MQPTPGFLPGEPPWTEEPGGLQCTGHRVGHGWVTERSTYMIYHFHLSSTSSCSSSSPNPLPPHQSTDRSSGKSWVWSRVRAEDLPRGLPGRIRAEDLPRGLPFNPHAGLASGQVRWAEPHHEKMRGGGASPGSLAGSPWRFFSGSKYGFSGF